LRRACALAREFGNLIADETEKWRKLIPPANVKAQDPRGPTWREMHPRLGEA